MVFDKAHQGGEEGQGSQFSRLSVTKWVDDYITNISPLPHQNSPRPRTHSKITCTSLSPKNIRSLLWPKLQFEQHCQTAHPPPPTDRPIVDRPPPLHSIDCSFSRPRRRRITTNFTAMAVAPITGVRFSDCPSSHPRLGSSIELRSARNLEREGVKG